jgi:hypothetical protein
MVLLEVVQPLKMMMMSTGLDNVSELRPPPGLLFIPQDMYEHGEPCRNYINRGKLLIRPAELSENPTISVI